MSIPPPPSLANQVFDEPGVDWRGVSPKLATMWQITALIYFAVPTVLGVAIGLLLRSWWAAAGVAPWLALWAWVAWLIPRRVRAIGYTERASDLMVRKGIMFRELTVVPYGRMQYLDVKTGPLARAFGLAKLTISTASTAGGADIPGLAPGEAARLRDHLAALGNAKMAGL
ncbi:MAG: PH domain-containing protein, partial [Bifidobacteriaceae bacterium]|jgi:membrane protein YdbS with pleckstrin-like domain|nr:PH domain-containing protein [Bifidobacteriaceae bacterium]